MPARSLPVQPNLEHLKNQAKALRTHVQASRGLQDAVRAFLAAAMNRDRAAALSVLRTEPRVATISLIVPAVRTSAGTMTRECNPQLPLSEFFGELRRSRV
jgi:hypothetical protein